MSASGVSWSKEEVIQAMENAGNVKFLEHINLSNTEKCIEQAPVNIFYMRGLQCSRDPRLAYHFWANFACRHQFHLFTSQPKDECINATIYLYVPDLDAIEKSLAAVADELKDTKFTFERLNRGGDTTWEYPQEKWHEIFDTTKYDHLKVHDPYGNEIRLHVTPQNYHSINKSLGKNLPVTNDTEGVAQGFPFLLYPCRPGIAHGISRFFEHYLGAKTVVTKKEEGDVTELYRTSVFCGPLQTIVFDEQESQIHNKGEYDGHHVCIHIDRFKEFYDKAREDSMNWNNVRFFDRCDTWAEANRDQQYRILHLVDPVDRTFLMSFEMEIRSAQHFRYLIHRSDVTPEEEAANEGSISEDRTLRESDSITHSVLCRIEHLAMQSDATKSPFLSRRGAASMHLPTSKRSLTLHKNSFQLHLHSDTKTLQERLKEKQEIKRILERASTLRDAHEIDTLYDWIRRNGSTTKIFQGVQEIICKTICREMTLLEVPSQGLVCSQGDYGDTFYIILAGSVSLYMDAEPKPRSPFDEDSYPIFQLADEEDVPQRPKDYGAFLKHISDGGTFGELAVMDPMAKRTCTIICNESTSFICLKRGAYQRLIRMTNSSQLEFTPIEFLETMYCFDAWPHSELLRLSTCLRQVNYPANSYLSRSGTDATVAFFICAGLVQETVPMRQVLDEKGSVQRCAELESTLAGRKMGNQSRGRVPRQWRRTDLELSLYQDHDICGEYPLFFSRPTYTTDLLAVTDVKTLVLDRETWKVVFYMHALDHIRQSFSKLRLLAQARENWRQTRVKLAIANPGLSLTISTKAMMQEGKCRCGWCGNADHTTGDARCPSLAASKKKLKEREQTAEAKRKKKPLDSADAVTESVHAVMNGNPLARKKSNGPFPMSTTIVPGVRRPSFCAAARQSPRLKLKQLLIDTNKMQEKQKRSHPLENHKLPRTSDSLLERCEQYSKDEQTLRAVKVEHVRKEPFTEGLVDQYKHEMVRRVRQLTSMEQYIGIRAKVLDEITASPCLPSEFRPTQPTIPKPCHRRGNPKIRADRFTRNINRMMKKIWRNNRQLPVVEECLRDP